MEWQIYYSNSTSDGKRVKFIEMPLQGAYRLELEPVIDERGFFARAWCQQEFKEYDLNPNLVQCNISFNHRKGTLRGMHYQAKPHAEVKLVRCISGAIYDVIIDLRPQSPTFMQWTAIELTAANRHMLYIPAGLAHGFQTLLDNTEVFYHMSARYHPESAKGIRWDDPAFNIHWPPDQRIMSTKDLQYYDFK